MPNLADDEAALHDALDAIGPAPRAELLHTLELTDFQRAERIGTLWASPHTRPLADLLIDAEESKEVRALLIGMLRERQRGGWRS
jgi:hypothetical protein